MRELADFFARAPATVNGIQAGITLYVDAGPGTTGIPGSVNLPNVTAVAFETAKAAHFWNHERGGRKFAFVYIVFTDFHHVVDLSGTDNNENAYLVTVAPPTSHDLTTIEDAQISHGMPQLAGNGIIITSGTGAGHVRVVTNASAVDGVINDLILDVASAFTVQPDGTSSYVLFDSSSGIGHATFRNDGSFGPGKNLASTLGGFGAYSPFVSQWIDPSTHPYQFIETPGFEQEVLAHEIGHLITLKHGRINHDNYKPDFVSLMNHAHDLDGRFKQAPRRF